MKTFLRSALLVLGIVSIAFAALSDSAAMTRARTQWGLQGGINKFRKPSDVVWNTQVGVVSPQCATSFTAFGTGTNTWDSAFDDATAHNPPVAGPYKQMLDIQASAFDDVSVVGMDFFIDGALVGMRVTPMTPTMTVTLTKSFDTTGLANGIHVLCVRAYDAGTNMGASPAGKLFSTNQTTGSASQVWSVVWN